MHEVLARIIAQRTSRAFPKVSAYEVSPDNAPAFGVAPIHVVAEELIQAVAFGRLDAEPNIVVEHHPLSRRSEFLEPLAQGLEEYLNHAIDSGFGRIYLPHEAALRSLELVGARFEHNREATPLIRRLGYLCRIISELADTPGQQFVVVMTDVLRNHVATGQSPAKDGHLRALTTWLNPSPGSDVAAEADRIALIPTAGILDQGSDAEVERLRHMMRRRPGIADQLRGRIEDIQRRGARTDWDALIEAHGAFWDLGLAQNPRLANHLADDLRTVRYRVIEEERARATRAVAMSRIFDARVLAAARHEAAKVENDQLHFVRARQRGRAFIGTITAVHYLRRRNQRPCEMTIDVAPQRLLRVRQGTAIRARHALIGGVVRAINHDLESGRYTLTVNVTVGANRALAGAEHAWLDGQVVDLRRAKEYVYGAVEQRRPALVYEPEVLNPPRQADPAVDLLAVVRQLESGA